MLKYSPKVYLVFKLPNGTTHSGFFRQNQRLGDIVTGLWPGGKTELDQENTIGGLGLKNDTVIAVKRKNRWLF
ncbi:unnamed protein product [marine sediment metagenome]|uniref:UBX domain-containing protein n=1 Tax=marine sediment metagenome TaxID=412755 RepID=X1GE06_9ZZZZ